MRLDRLCVMAGLKFNKNRTWLFLPPLALCMLDLAATLLGQSASYWYGDYLYITEGNPIAYFLLATHPSLYIIGTAAWIATFSVLMIRLPRRLALALCFFISFAHLWGTLGWIMQCSVLSGCSLSLYSPATGYLISVVLTLAASILLVAAVEKSAAHN
jgi:hypothetical protein